MIWATVSSRSCFCWLYRASPSLATKNIINLISLLTIWWCPCVESSVVLLEEGVCYDQCVLLAKLISLCPASFQTPRPNLPVTPGVPWLPAFAFQSPIMKRTSFPVPYNEKDMAFPVVMYRCDSCTIKKAEHWKNDDFKLWCWKRLLRVPWRARRSNQSVLKEINPEYSLQRLMLKLKLQYFG